MYISLLIALSITEIVLVFMVLHFFSRLRKSEELLTRLREGQDSLLDKLRANAELERELMQSFACRQKELAKLDSILEERAQVLQKLLDQAEKVSRSPQFLRELIYSGHKNGKSSAHLAKATGLSIDEVELILSQNKML